MVDARSFSMNHIDYNVVRKGNSRHFFGVYGCPAGQNKKVTCELLRRLASNDDFPWLVGGNLNECLWAKEKCGGMESNFRSMKMFREVVDELQLRDLGYVGDVFTWSNKDKKALIIMKHLYRFLCHNSFHQLYDQVEVCHLYWYSSDHRPIYLKVASGGSTVPSRRRMSSFKFEELWVPEDRGGFRAPRAPPILLTVY